MLDQVRFQILVRGEDIMSLDGVDMTIHTIDKHQNQVELTIRDVTKVFSIEWYEIISMNVYSKTDVYGGGGTISTGFGGDTHGSISDVKSRSSVHQQIRCRRLSDNREENLLISQNTIMVSDGQIVGLMFDDSRGLHKEVGIINLTTDQTRFYNKALSTSRLQFDGADSTRGGPSLIAAVIGLFVFTPLVGAALKGDAENYALLLSSIPAIHFVLWMVGRANFRKNIADAIELKSRQYAATYFISAQSKLLTT